MPKRDRFPRLNDTDWLNAESQHHTDSQIAAAIGHGCTLHIVRDHRKKAGILRPHVPHIPQLNHHGEPETETRPERAIIATCPHCKWTASISLTWRRHQWLPEPDQKITTHGDSLVHKPCHCKLTLSAFAQSPNNLNPLPPPYANPTQPTEEDKVEATPD